MTESGCVIFTHQLYIIVMPRGLHAGKVYKLCNIVKIYICTMSEERDDQVSRIKHNTLKK